MIPTQFGQLDENAIINDLNAASQSKPDQGKSGGHQGCLRLPAIGHEANTSEAEDHHGPGGRLGDCARHGYSRYLNVSAHYQ